MPTTVVNGNVTLTYEVQGPDDGEPVLLVMGLGAQLVVWPQGFVDRLVEGGHRVVRFDNRDVGESSRIDAPAPTIRQLARAFAAPRRARTPYSIADMADDAAGLLDHLGIARAHVIGASMGGMISQELAIRHPEKVATLCSIMSNTGRRGKGAITPSLLPALARARSEGVDGRAVEDAVAIERLIGGPHFDEEAARALSEITTARSGDPKAAAEGLARQTLAVAATRDRTEDLGRLDVPALVVHGLADRLVRPSGGIATALAIPGARLIAFPDMAHDVPVVRHAELVEQIFLNFDRARIEPATPVAVEATAAD